MSLACAQKATASFYLLSPLRFKVLLVCYFAARSSKAVQKHNSGPKETCKWPTDVLPLFKSDVFSLVLKTTSSTSRTIHTRCGASTWCGDVFLGFASTQQDLCWHAHKTCQVMRPSSSKIRVRPLVSMRCSLGFSLSAHEDQPVPLKWKQSTSSWWNVCWLSTAAVSASGYYWHTHTSGQTQAVTSRQSHEKALCTWTYILCKHSQHLHKLTWTDFYQPPICRYFACRTGLNIHKQNVQNVPACYF